jgi:hypothetical protein
VSECFSLVKSEVESMSIEYDDAEGDRITLGRDEQEVAVMIEEMVRWTKTIHARDWAKKRGKGTIKKTVVNAGRNIFKPHH